MILCWGFSGLDSASSLSVTPHRGGAVTFLLGEIGRRNKVCSSTFSVPLGVVPGTLNKRPRLRSLSAVTVELVSPLSFGVSIRMPVCSQISAPCYGFSFVNCQGEIWFYFLVQNSGWGGGWYWLDSFENLIVLTCTGRKVAEGLRLSTRIPRIAFSKCISPSPSFLSPTDLTPPQPL